MSIVGVFTQSRPSIHDMFFDAVLEESTELITDVTEFPIESGALGSDHAVQRPLTITMRVGISDNPSRALRAEAGNVFGALAGGITGTLLGSAIGRQGGSTASLLGVGAGAVNAAFTAGQASTRSQSALDRIREIQAKNQLINIVASKREYQNCLITNTRQETNKENEQSLELVVELRQLIIVPIEGDNNLFLPSEGDTSFTQGQPLQNLGLIG